MIQTPDFNYRGVPYGKDLRKKFIKVEENHSSIKMKNIKKKTKTIKAIQKQTLK